MGKICKEINYEKIQLYQDFKNTLKITKINFYKKKLTLISKKEP